MVELCLWWWWWLWWCEGEVCGGDAQMSVVGQHWAVQCPVTVLPVDTHTRPSYIDIACGSMADSRASQNLTTSGRGTLASILLMSTYSPLSSDWQRLSYDICLEVRVEIIRSVLLCIVYWSCAQSSTLRWRVLTVLWIVLSHWAHFTVRRFMCVYLRIFCVFVSYCISVVSLGAWWGGPDGIEA